MNISSREEKGVGGADMVQNNASKASVKDVFFQKTARKHLRGKQITEKKHNYNGVAAACVPHLDETLRRDVVGVGEHQELTARPST